MKTVKLPLKNKIEISDYQRGYSKIVRISYNLFKDGLPDPPMHQRNLPAWD